MRLHSYGIEAIVSAELARISRMRDQAAALRLLLRRAAAEDASRAAMMRIAASLRLAR